MKILSPKQIKAVDAYTIEQEPVSSVDLMERAATACVHHITKHFARRSVAVFAGPGNNGGDGLAIARILKNMHYDVSVFMLADEHRLSPDALENYHRLSGCNIRPQLITEKQLPEILPSTVVIDALFGVGLSRPLDGLAATVVNHINRSNATVVSIDMPSGLFCESNEDNDPHSIIRAKYTFTFQQPKLSFFFVENSAYVGKWMIIDIGLSQDAIQKQSGNLFTLEAHHVAGWVKPRDKFAHKGNFGHACIISGSYGMMGASVLSVRACMRTGAGLVTAHIPRFGNMIMQASVPEAIISFDNHMDYFTTVPDLGSYSAIGVGPGIGKVPETQKALLALLHMVGARQHAVSIRLVLDADALNILSENKEWMNLIPPNTIITPHPKEFDRLAGKSKNAYQRFQKQLEIARKYAIFVVLKGAYTSIATPDGSCFFNTSGNPGMATAGSGDVLTGMIVSLLTQGWTPFHAACAGVWIHGAAGDLAEQQVGQEALIASDIINNIGKVFIQLHE